MSSSADERGLLHHIEIWVPDLAASASSWGWLLGQLGYEPLRSWQHGVSFRLGPTYVVLEQSPAMTPGHHERRRPGVNHLSFHAGSRREVDQLAAAAGDHGWNLMFGDRHPFAGGEEHYAAYLEDEAGYEVELVGT